MTWNEVPVVGTKIHFQKINMTFYMSQYMTEPLGGGTRRFNQIPFTGIFDRASFSFCVYLNALNQFDALSKSENEGLS